MTTHGLRTTGSRKPALGLVVPYLAPLALVVPLVFSCNEQRQPDGTEEVSAVISEVSYSEWPAQTLVALDSIQIGANATVFGDLAVVRSVVNRTRSELSLQAGARLLGNAQANALELAASSTIQGDAAYNVLTGSGAITGTQTTPLAIPLPIAVPAAPAVTLGADNVTVSGGGMRTLAPGKYNVLTINASSRLLLSGGLYQFRRVGASAQSRVECAAACEVRVLENAVFQANAAFGPAASSTLGVSDVQLIVLGGNTPFDQVPSALQFAPEASVAAYVYVPNGAFRAGGIVAGKVVARDVFVTSGSIDGYNLPVIVEAPESQQIREQKPASFDVLAQGHELSYQWLRNDQEIEGATGPSYTLPSLALSDDGARFSVRVANRAGTVTSSAAVLTVLPCESSDATCDGVDQDCSGEADEDYVSSSTQCGIGECATTGTLACVGGVEKDDCAPGTPKESDGVCDAKDEDCDGSVDEDYVSVDTRCGTGTCSAVGQTSCVGGGVVDSCQPGTPGPEDVFCDGIDSDCDGSADESYVPVAIECGLGACRRSGATVCVSGGVVDQCSPGAPAPDDAMCNGTDDDCDGAVDEDYVALSTTCGIGACRSTGTTSCSSGGVADSCREGSPLGTDRNCDGIDDDCDGQTDEDYVSQATSCGVGACAAVGTTACADGAVVDGCVPGTPSPNDASCDGIDNDCDGQADEDYVSLSTTCGVGACSAVGVTSCAAGAVVDSCLAGAPAGTDATCDGADDDCDGSVDEDYAALPTVCGTGACRADGTTSCVAGRVSDSCAPGAPGAADQVCNGIDDDCDGQIDEEYVVRTTSCGIGICRASGTITCEDGSLVTHCTAGAGAPNDALCDGVDDDCDGAVDEDYEALSIRCGTGACLAVGTTACVGGVVEEQCVPANPALGDATCDGVDEDCDGIADEDYARLPTACGAGACQSEGFTRCIGGQVRDTCRPASPGSSDDTCDGVDQDCDGRADEEYVPVASFCGTGACRGMGQLVCESGRLVDICQPSAPTGTDDDCDGVDDDCDGQADAGFVAACQGASVATCVDGSVRLAECSDGDPCTGEESCGTATCLPGVPPIVDDLNPCTIDACEPFLGEVHAFSPAGTPCGEGLVCSGTGACIGTPAVTLQAQALAVDVRYPTSLRFGVRDGVLTYQFASWTGSGAVRSQPLAGGYGPLRIPPPSVPWFSYSLQPLRIEIGNVTMTLPPLSLQSLPSLNTLYVHIVAGRRGPGSIEVIPVGVGN